LSKPKAADGPATRHTVIYQGEFALPQRKKRLVPSRVKPRYLHRALSIRSVAVSALERVYRDPATQGNLLLIETLERHIDELHQVVATAMGDETPSPNSKADLSPQIVFSIPAPTNPPLA
jgi:hypothetical protein